MEDLSLKEAQVLLGKLTAIFNKLDNPESGAIQNLEKILEKIDPTIINLNATNERKELEEQIKRIEKALLTHLTDFESIYNKNLNEAKKISCTILEEATNEVLRTIEKKQQEELPESKSGDKLTYLNMLLFGFSIGLVIGIFI